MTSDDRKELACLFGAVWDAQVALSRAKHGSGPASEEEQRRHFVEEQLAVADLALAEYRVEVFIKNLENAAAVEDYKNLVFSAAAE